MSYDITVVDENGNIIEVEEPFFVKGANYPIDGSIRLSISVTYNYSSIFRKKEVFGENGIYELDRCTVDEAVMKLVKAKKFLEGEDDRFTSDSYWACSISNVINAISSILEMILKAPLKSKIKIES